MEKVYSHIPKEKWVFASVAVAPSTITVTEHKVWNLGMSFSVNVWRSTMPLVAGCTSTLH
jgi:hypothetical protein